MLEILAGAFAALVFLLLMFRFARWRADCDKLDRGDRYQRLPDAPWMNGGRK